MSLAAGAVAVGPAVLEALAAVPGVAAPVPVVPADSFVTFRAIKRIADAMRYEFCVEPFNGRGHYKLIMAGDAIDAMLEAQSVTVPGLPTIAFPAANKPEI